MAALKANTNESPLEHIPAPDNKSAIGSAERKR